MFKRDILYPPSSLSPSPQGQLYGWPLKLACVERFMLVFQKERKLQQNLNLQQNRVPSQLTPTLTTLVLN